MSQTTFIYKWSFPIWFFYWSKDFEQHLQRTWSSRVDADIAEVAPFGLGDTAHHEAQPTNRNERVKPERPVQPQRLPEVHEGLHRHEGAQVAESRRQSRSQPPVLQGKQLARQQPGDRADAQREGNGEDQRAQKGDPVELVHVWVRGVLVVGERPEGRQRQGHEYAGRDQERKSPGAVHQEPREERRQQLNHGDGDGRHVGVGAAESLLEDADGVEVKGVGPAKPLEEHEAASYDGWRAEAPKEEMGLHRNCSG